MSQIIKILAVSGSLRAKSTNTMLVRAAAGLAPEDMQIDFFEGLNDLPHFTPDLDGEAAPPAVVNWREALKMADGVLLCTPEYAFGVPGVLKNALDWAVSSGEFYEKPTAVISASPMLTGGDKAQASLLLTLKALGAKVADEVRLAVPMVNKKLTPGGAIADPALREALTALLAAFAGTISDIALAPAD